MFVFPKYVDYSTEDEILSRKMTLICQLLNKYSVFNSTYDSPEFLINNFDDEFISSFAISRFCWKTICVMDTSQKLLILVLMKRGNSLGKTVSEINPY